jgi:hypothetical protein
MARDRKDASIFLSYKIVTNDLDKLVMHDLNKIKPLDWERSVYYFNAAATFKWMLLASKAFSHKDAAPPSSAFLSALLPTSMSEDVIENLNELFDQKWLPRHGSRTARRIWRTQATQIVLKHWLGPITAILDRIERLRTGR